MGFLRFGSIIHPSQDYSVLIIILVLLRASRCLTWYYYHLLDGPAEATRRPLRPSASWHTGMMPTLDTQVFTVPHAAVSLAHSTTYYADHNQYPDTLPCLPCSVCGIIVCTSYFTSEGTTWHSIPEADQDSTEVLQVLVEFCDTHRIWPAPGTSSSCCCAD